MTCDEAAAVAEAMPVLVGVAAVAGMVLGYGLARVADVFADRMARRVSERLHEAERSER